MNIIESISKDKKYNHFDLPNCSRINFHTFHVGINKNSGNSYWFKVWLHTNSDEYVGIFTIETLSIINDKIKCLYHKEPIELIEMFETVKTMSQLEEFANKLLKIYALS